MEKQRICHISWQPISTATHFCPFRCPPSLIHLAIIQSKGHSDSCGNHLKNICRKHKALLLLISPTALQGSFLCPSWPFHMQQEYGCLDDLDRCWLLNQPLGVLECPSGHIVISSAFHIFLACIVHSGKVGALVKIKEHWWGLSISPSLETTVKMFSQSLVHSIPVARTWNILEDLFLNLQMNFISLPQKRTYCYSLVIVDMFSKWIEACWAWEINKWLMPHFNLS